MKPIKALCSSWALQMLTSFISDMRKRLFIPVVYCTWTLLYLKVLEPVLYFLSQLLLWFVSACLLMWGWITLNLNLHPRIMFLWNILTTFFLHLFFPFFLNFHFCVFVKVDVCNIRWGKSWNSTPDLCSLCINLIPHDHTPSPSFLVLHWWINTNDWEDPGQYPGHTGEIISPDWPGKTSVFPRMSWRKWLGRGRSGLLCSGCCCPHILAPDKWEKMDGWVFNICFSFFQFNHTIEWITF